MKFSREVLIGLVGIVTILVSIWGYKYLKGENIFSSDNDFYVEYPYIDQLTKSDPVLINGFQVGSVLDIKLNEENNNTLIVHFSVIGDIKVPPGSVASIVPASLLGGKALNLKLNGICAPGECLKSGDMLEGSITGFLESMLSVDDVDSYISSVNQGVKQFIDTLDKSIQESEMRDGIGKSVKDLETTISYLKVTTAEINDLVQSLNAALPSIFKNIDGIAGNLNKEGATIDSLLQNLASISSDIKNSNLGEVINNTNELVTRSGDTMEALEKTSNELKDIMTAINQGEGSLGKLISDQELYDNLNKSTRNLDLLLQDLRLNPKRYIHVSVFGKKGTDYEVPENDPAFQDGRD